MMNEKDRELINQIITMLEKANEMATSIGIDDILSEINELKDSIDERLENVADFEGLSQTDANLEKEDASEALDEIITNLDALQTSIDEIDNAIESLRNLA